MADEQGLSRTRIYEPGFCLALLERFQGMVYPFPAIVGQQDMKLALLLNAVDPGIGGVLVRGQKGTAKSTAVRGLARLLPLQTVVAGCAVGCDPMDRAHLCHTCQSRVARGERLPLARRSTPVVELPLGATEDMVLGSFDFQHTLQEGVRRFQPGLLAKAHRGLLYVDEVNLLVDHLVDVILDAAGSGVNTVEREGISYSHPARFALVGTMNPEEGELRPQFLDRFGLCVAVEGETDPEARARLLEQREGFDADPQAFAALWQEECRSLTQKLVTARALLEQVVLERHVLAFIANLCRENHVAGHRADLVLRRAARALAALEGRSRVSQDDVARLAPLVLRHRRREAQPPSPPPPPPPPPPQDSPEQKDDQKEQADGPQPTPESHSQPAPQPDQEQEGQRPPDSPQGEEAGGRDQVFAVGATFKVKALEAVKDRKARTGSGRRSLSRAAMRRGRYSRSSQHGEGHDLALDATVRAAAVHQKRRSRREHMALAIEQADWRYKIREARFGSFLLFVVDASGSMGAQARMVAAKGAVMSLLLDAYQKRDKVALVSFRGEGAQVVLPPTSSVETSARLLAELPVGGRTPLAAGIAAAQKILRRQLRREPLSRPIALLITDGKANAGLGQGDPWAQAMRLASLAGADPRVRWVVVDTEAKEGFSLGLAERLAQALQADCYQTQQLKARDLVEWARS